MGFDGFEWVRRVEGGDRGECGKGGGGVCCERIEEDRMDLKSATFNCNDIFDKCWIF